MKISCIIPTYNRLELLEEAIRSILAQTFNPCEIIIVNNGREKLTLPDDLSKKVIVYNIVPEAGVSQARNFGACVATGDYLAFLDDDDLWSAAYLENVSQAIAKGAVCLISRLDMLIDGKIVPGKNAHGKITLDKLLVQNPGTGGPNTVISKKLFFAVGGYDPKLPTSEDKSLIIELIKRGEKITTLPDNQVIARYHKATSRLSDDKNIAEGIYQFTKKYSSLMNKKQYFYNWYKIFYHRYKSGDVLAGVFCFFLCLFYAPKSIIKKALRLFK